MKYVAWSLIAGIASSMAIGSNIAPASAVTLTLYDGASNVTPNNYTPNYLSFNSIGSGIAQTVSGGVTTLNTNTANNNLGEGNYAGYSNYNTSGNLVNAAFPTLDNSAGYTLSFRMKVNSQTNNGTNGANRAGFIVTVLGSNNKGIEIGFRNPNTQPGVATADIFSQTGASFIVGEQNTSVGTLLNNLNTYDLTILGNNYTLKNNGTTLLNGLLRDYRAAAVPNTLTAVYALPSFLFFGDNTTSAGASVDIASITLNTAAVAEPSQWLGIGVAIGLGVKLQRKLCKTDSASPN